MHSAKKSYVSTQFMHYVFFDTILNNIRLYEIAIIMFIYLSSTVMDDVSSKVKPATAFSKSKIKSGFIFKS
jgi:hypothetical protein